MIATVSAQRALIAHRQGKLLGAEAAALERSSRSPVWTRLPRFC